MYLLQIVVLFAVVGCLFYYLSNKEDKVDILVSMEYILFCLSEDYQIDPKLLEPLIRNNFTLDHVRKILRNRITLNDLVSRFGIQVNIAENLVDYITNQTKQECPFSEARIGEFLWRKTKIHDAISNIQDITNEHEHVNKNDTFIYKVSDGNFHIFNNLSKLKETINNRVPKALRSHQRCRMSFEIKGQPRTGKTHCSRYVLPYFCATLINQQREREGLKKLCRAPVFYVVLGKNENPLNALYFELKRLSEIIQYHPTKEPKDNAGYIAEIRHCINSFFNVYYDSHMFIVLDEIQLIDSTYLDSLRVITKSKDFPKCSFILTGSTMSMHNLIMSKTYRNGLSYFDNTVEYNIPFSNSSEYIEETLKVLFDRGVLVRGSITFKEELEIRSYCTKLNIAYVSQILKYEHDLEISFSESLFKLIQEIFNIYERDIYIEEPIVESILNGDLESLEYSCFITRKKERLVLTDKLLTIFLYNNFVFSKDEKTVIKQTKEIDRSITMIYIRILGERISKYLKWKDSNPTAEIPRAYSVLEEFFTMDDCLLKARDSVLVLCNKLKPLFSTKDLTAKNTDTDMSKTRLLQHLFVSMRYLICNQSGISNIDNECKKVLRSWLTTDEEYSKFIINVIQANSVYLKHSF